MQPTNSPYPTNAQLTDAFNDAIADINRTCHYHVVTIYVPVDGVASSELGPFGMHLSDMAPNTSGQPNLYAPQGFLNDIRRVTWIPDGGVPVIVEAKYRDNLDRSGTFDYWSMPPSTPRYWYVEGYTVYFMPAQAQAGSYHFTINDGIAGFTCDTSTLDQIPFEYQNIFEDRAIFRLSITQTMDVEAQARAGYYGPMSERGMQQFREWIMGGTGAPEPTMAFRSYRSGYGRFRVVR